MHNCSNNIESLKCNCRNIENIVKNNKYKSIVSIQPNLQYYHNNNKNNQTLSYYFPTNNGFNSIDDNIFVTDKPKIKRQKKKKNMDGEAKKKYIIINTNEKTKLGKSNKTNNNMTNIRNRNTKKKKNINEQTAINNNSIQLEEENNNMFDFYNFQNNDYNKINEKYEYMINLNNENKIKKNIRKKKDNDPSISMKKKALTSKKKKISNFNIENDLQTNRNIYLENFPGFNLNAQNNQYFNFSKKQSKNTKPNVINSSIININSAKKRNKSTQNKSFYDKLNYNINYKNNENELNKNFQNQEIEKENLLKSSNAANEIEKVNLKDSYIPQVFESQNSSTIIGGVEYTTLLVPKKYLGKIKSQIFGE